LSSSTFAIAGTLQTIINRLRKIVEDHKIEDDDLISDIADDIPELEEYEEEWDEDEEGGEDDAIK
jgi:hypothetical protein